MLGGICQQTQPWMKTLFGSNWYLSDFKYKPFRVPCKKSQEMLIMDRNTDNTNKFTVVCTKWGIKHLSNWISPGLSFARLTLVVVPGRCKLASVIRWASHGSQSTGPQPIGSHLVSFHNSYNCYLRLLGLKMMRQESQQGPSDNGNAKRRKISSTPQPKVYAVWNNKVEHSKCKISSSHQETQVMMTWIKMRWLT